MCSVVQDSAGRREFLLENHFDHSARWISGNWDLALRCADHILVDPDQSNVVFAPNFLEFVLTILACFHDDTFVLSSSILSGAPTTIVR